MNLIGDQQLKRLSKKPLVDIYISSYQLGFKPIFKGANAYHFSVYESSKITIYKNLIIGYSNLLGLFGPRSILEDMNTQRDFFNYWKEEYGKNSLGIFSDIIINRLLNKQILWIMQHNVFYFLQLEQIHKKEIRIKYWELFSKPKITEGYKEKMIIFERTTLGLKIGKPMYSGVIGNLKSKLILKDPILLENYDAKENKANRKNSIINIFIKKDLPKKNIIGKSLCYSKKLVYF